MKERNDIGFKVRILANLLKRDIEKSKCELGIELPKGINGWAISYFFDNSDKDIFQKDFENEFSIRRSTASNILKTMEQNGFIKRESVESDARLKKIVLTEKAINIHKSVLRSINEREERLRKGLTAEEAETFLKITDKLIANMEESND
ncbi:MAG: MarR family transcriptional regulator [Clostridia bacterium]|nr:MarR family transcriptional regulator [Clostridia bacterium]MBR6563894.1 MarR family transcriptional regulator [Clostridia bacterium]